MKRVISAFLAAVIVLSLSACGKKKNAVEESAEITADPTMVAAENMPTPSPTPAETPPPFELPEDVIGLPEDSEAQVPDVSEHAAERTVVYVRPDNGKTVEEERIPAEEHRWGYESADSGHWQVCVLCGEKGELQIHDLDAEGRCPVCGHGCEHAFTEEVIAPTCAASGYTTHTCDLCGYAYDSDPLPPAGHAYHSTIETPAACTEDGVVRYTCEVCGESFTQAIPARGHVTVVEPAVEATCRSEGRTEGAYCSVCGEVLSAQETIPVRDHFYVDGACIWCGAEAPADAPENDPTELPPEFPEPFWSGGELELPEDPLN